MHTLDKDKIQGNREECHYNLHLIFDNMQTDVQTT